MSAVGVGRQRLDAYQDGTWTAPPFEPAERLRISGRRVLWIALPGLVLLDALLVGGSFLAALHVIPAASTLPAPDAPHLQAQLIALFVVLVASFLLFGGMFGLYARQSMLVPRYAMRLAARAILWSGAVAVAFAFLLALDPPGDLRWLLALHAALLSFGVLTLRPLAAQGLLRLTQVGPVVPRRILVLGCSPEARRTAARLEESDPKGIEIAGLAVPRGESFGEVSTWPRFPIEDSRAVAPLADALAVDEVVLATPHAERADAVELSEDLARAGIALHVVPHLTHMFVEGTPCRRERGVPLARLGVRRPKPWEARLKRTVDLVVTGIGGLLLLPLLMVIALAVRLSSPGAVLYPQTRVGRDGRTFRMYKFRSMVASNDDSRHRCYVATLVKEGSAAGTDAAGRPIYKIVDDPRVTAVGRMIRWTSLDELPQLINVLKGEMSLVGPRPCLPFEYELYEDWQRRRLAVMPGMTGLWQVSGRSLMGFEDMVLLDLYYVANWSFLLDLRILWRTIPEVLGAGKGR